MTLPVIPSPETVVTFLFVLLRLGALLAAAPPFGSSQVPWQVRAALTLVLTLVAAPLAPQAPPPEGMPHLLLAGVRELLIGLALGFVAQIVFMAVELAGEVLDANSGFSASAVLSPAFGTHAAVLGQFQMALATMVFLAMDGHHQVVRGAVDSLRLLPPGVLSLSPAAELSVDLVGRFFLTGLRLAAPALVAVLLSDVALCMLARSAPAMNLFTIGFPIKMAVGIIALAATLPFFVASVQRLFSDLYADMRVVAGALG